MMIVSFTTWQMQIRNSTSNHWYHSSLALYTKVNIARSAGIDTCAGCIIIIIVMMQDQFASVFDFLYSTRDRIDQRQYSHTVTTKPELIGVVEKAKEIIHLMSIFLKEQRRHRLCTLSLSLPINWTSIDRTFLLTMIGIYHFVTLYKKKLINLFLWEKVNSINRFHHHFNLGLLPRYFYVSIDRFNQCSDYEKYHFRSALVLSVSAKGQLSVGIWSSDKICSA